MASILKTDAELLTVAEIHELLNNRFLPAIDREKLELELLNRSF